MKWLVATILALLVAITLELGLLAFAAYALLMIIGAGRILSDYWIRNLDVVRSASRLEGGVGDKVAIALRVQYTGRLPIPWVIIEDLLPEKDFVHRPPNLQIQGNRLSLAMLRAGKTVNVYYQLSCNRRGYYQLGPTILETGDLFGLHRRYRIGNTPHFLMIRPRLIELHHFDIASRRPIGEITMSHRLYEDPTRIAGLRKYQAGDPLNRVNWRATARTGVLHSKVYEPSTIAGATLLIDFHAKSHDARHEPIRSELAISMSAAVANAVYELGQQIGMISNGRDAADRIRQEGWHGEPRSRDAVRRMAAMRESSDRLRPVVVPTKRGPTQFRLILDHLARLELSDGLSFAELVTESTGNMPRDASVVVVSPGVTVDHAIALDGLVRQGFAVAAILNLYDEYDFAGAAGPLIASGVRVYHLRDKDHVASICRQFIWR
jgi:uncharacterized protein (DUF58 family)